MPHAAVRDQVRRVLLITLVLNFLVAFGKIMVGTLTGAISITADGFHSLIDGVSNVISLFANRLASRPPDEDHPYGHRRYETLAALMIGALLLLTAWEIVSGAVERLGSGEAPNITMESFAVLIGTLVINLFVSTYERREGRRLQSELLTADAANTSADVFVTLSVLASMTLTQLFGWSWADPVAALIIVLLIGRAGWQVLQQTGSVLVDTAPVEPARLIAIAEEIPSVQHIIRARSRGPADAVHVDIDVLVAPETTAGHTQAIADAIRDKLTTTLPGINEVEVHFAPQSDGTVDYALATRARADALGLSTHEVRVVENTNGLVLEMHVEVPPDLTLDDAHRRVSQLEHDVQLSLPDIADVLTHIEPALREAVPNPPSDTAGSLKSQAYTLLNTQYPGIEWHKLTVYPYTDGYALTLHATLPAKITVEAAHHIAEDAETALRAGLPMLERVTIHTEPPDA